MKDWQLILILVGIVLMVGLIFILFTIGNLRLPLSIVSYNNQCSLPSCPSGFTEVSKNCDNSLNKCIKTCQKITSARCGTYGSYNVVSSRSITGWEGSTDRGVSYNTPHYYVRSDTCYKLYANTRLTVSSWGTADSYMAYAANTWYSKTGCATKSVVILPITSTYTLGRGTSGSSYSAVGKITDYGGGTCSGGYPFLQLKGNLNIYLYAAKAPWIVAKTETQQVSCNYQCDKNSECGTDGYVGDNYCKNDNVYRDYRKYTCSSYKCLQPTITSLLVKNCPYGCKNGVCITDPIITVYRFESNTCTLLTILSSQKQSNDYTSLSQCQLNIERPITMYRLENNQCSQISILESERTTNDYYTLSECQANIISPPPQPKPLLFQFFDNLWSWIKGLFGG